MEVMSDTKHRKKCTRVELQGHAHEMTFSCHKRQPFLENEFNRKCLADTIIRSKGLYNYDVWAYVFMPEHVHLLIYPKDSIYSIGKILSSIKRPVGAKIVKQCKANHPDELKLFSTGQKDAPYRFWLAGGGYDRNITDVDILLSAVNYIHRNPVRRGLVENPEDWHWSSYEEWLKPGTGPIPVDREFFPMK
jgi:putative transposase